MGQYKAELILSPRLHVKPLMTVITAIAAMQTLPVLIFTKISNLCLVLTVSTTY